jgi:hypothetical protein
MGDIPPCLMSGSAPNKLTMPSIMLQVKSSTSVEAIGGHSKLQDAPGNLSREGSWCLS